METSMENELYRIASFRNWSGNGSLTLAKNGWYYSGVGDKFICYKCKVELGRWTSIDDIIERHKSQSPGCPLVNGNRENTGSPRATNLGNQGVRGTNITTCIGCEQRERIYSSAVGRSLNIANAEHQIDRLRPDLIKLRDEEARLTTFYDWPQDAHADPQELAREGLFYTGSRDIVQCVFCLGYIINWKPEDIPSVEHKKHFPECPFVRGLDVGNIRKTTTTSNESHSMQHKPVNKTIQSTIKIPQLKPENARTLLPEHCPRSAQSSCYVSPKYSEYSNMSHRIDSFKKGIVAQGQTAQCLAEAGFFHIGPGDKVLCFQCGGNLKDWEPEDDPLEQHKVWYPLCPYLKTRTVVSELAARRSPAPQQASAAVGSFPVEPREVKARMDTPTVRAILDMGYEKDLVKRAIEIRLTNEGDDFPNAETLLGAIFALQDEAASQASSSPLQTLSTTTATVASSRSSSPLQSLSTTTTEAFSSRSSSESNESSNLSDSVSSSPVHTPSSSAASSSASSQVRIPNECVVSPGNGSEEQPKAKGKRKRNKKKKKAAIGTTGQKQAQETETQASAEPELYNLGLLEGTVAKETQGFADENRRLREATTCKVCMEAEVDTVFLPCGHLVCCNRCCPLLRNCPICRTFVRGTVKTFLS